MLAFWLGGAAAAASGSVRARKGQGSWAHTAAAKLEQIGSLRPGLNVGSCVAIQFILQVEQSYALIPMEQQFAAIYHALRRHAEETPDHKV